MRAMSWSLALILIGCAAKALPQDSGDQTPDLWSYEAVSADLRAQSCSDDVIFERPNPLPLSVVEIDPGTAEAHNKDLIGFELAGAWHLTSQNLEFGGLSGLDILPSGSLLLVTDDGKFVWVGIDSVTGAPDGFAAMSKMRDRNGAVFPRKRAADAEDLALRDGLAFVSFEQDHRIYAYDLEGCGAAAKAALVANLDGVIDGQSFDRNRGAEALAFDDDQLMFGVETRNTSGSPIGTLRTDGTTTDTYRTKQPLLFLLTGMDRTADLTATLFRAYDPILGARGFVKLEAETGLVAEARLRAPLPADNFEGIAIGESPAGKVRVWVVSDDNFSRDQRTLLLALDLTE